MVTPAIPERVYALCKIVEKKAMPTAEVKEKMEPSYLNQTTSYYYDYRNAAEELQLVTITDNVLSLGVDVSVLKNMDTMRFYINGQLDQFREGQFYKVTKAYYDMGESILYGEQNVANMASLMTLKTGISVDSGAMRAWRFWASYLGFGYLQDMFVIPNADIFLCDTIKRGGFDKNKRYSIFTILVLCNNNCTGTRPRFLLQKIFRQGRNNRRIYLQKHAQFSRRTELREYGKHQL